jgi:hypothetical protein
MKKDLVIPMEEECVDCPKLELETLKFGMQSIHRCIHVDFCKSIVRHFITCGWRKEGKVILNECQAEGEAAEEGK